MKASLGERRGFLEWEWGRQKYRQKNEQTDRQTSPLTYATKEMVTNNQ